LSEAIYKERVYPKIPSAPPPRKNTSITFRVTDELREVLERAATLNSVTLSTFVAAAIEHYCGAPILEYKKAQYLNTCDNEMRNEILRLEKKLPPEFRDFANARHTYPEAGILDPADAERFKSFLTKAGDDE
jgi:uncharacterized protein (DUF1778 family)